MPKQFSEDFKRQAVDLYETTEGATLASIAEDLGIGKSTLSLWLQKYRNSARLTPGKQPPILASENDELTTLRLKNRALEAEKTKLETERDILRQAAKYFAGETNW